MHIKNDLYVVGVGTVFTYITTYLPNYRPCVAFICILVIKRVEHANYYKH